MAQYADQLTAVYLDVKQKALHDRGRNFSRKKNLNDGTPSPTNAIVGIISCSFLFCNISIIEYSIFYAQAMGLTTRLHFIVLGLYFQFTQN